MPWLVDLMMFPGWSGEEIAHVSSLAAMAVALMISVAAVGAASEPPRAPSKKYCLLASPQGEGALLPTAARLSVSPDSDIRAANFLLLSRTRNKPRRLQVNRRTCLCVAFVEHSDSSPSMV